MERVIDCPCCKDIDSCFEEVQENFSSFICFKCGFMSDSRFEHGSLQTIENEKTTPKLPIEPEAVTIGSVTSESKEKGPSKVTDETSKSLPPELK